MSVRIPGGIQMGRGVRQQSNAVSQDNHLEIF